MTKDKGRGVFATKFLKRGDIIVVEKAVVKVKLCTQISEETKLNPIKFNFVQ